MARLPDFRTIFRLPRRGLSGRATEVDEEIEAHLALRVDQLIEAGWEPEAALAEARRRFGDPLLARSSLIASATRRDTSMVISQWLDSLRQDVSFALRQIRRYPGFAAIEVTTFALAIGLATAVFAAVHGVMLRPLPFADPDRLVNLQSADSLNRSIETVSSDNYLDWVRENRTMEGMALYQSRRYPIFASGEAVRVAGAMVTPNLAEVVRPRLLFGRAFSADQRSVGVPEAMISEGLWRRALGSRRDTTLAITVNGRDYRVVGVLAAGQEFPEATDLWLPFTARSFGGAARNNINFLAVGRLRAGVSPEQAEADLGAVARGIREREPAGIYSWGVPVTPLREYLAGPSAAYLVMVLGAVGLVVLISCANLASANLARAVGREREMAVRTAVGGGRGRLMQLLLTERIVVALLGGAAGVALAHALTGLLRAGAGALPRSADIGVEPTVVLFAFAVSLGAGILAGALPARMASRARLTGTLGSGSRGSARGWRGTPGRLLVAGQVAVAVLLVAGAGLLVQSFRTLLARPLGFDANGLVIAEITLNGPGFGSQTPEQLAFWRDLLEGVRTSGTAQAAGLANWIPLGGGGASFVEVAGREFPGAGARYRVIGEGYLEALGVSLLRGRMFTAADDSAAPRVTLINQAMADRFWPGEDPLGRMVRAPSMESFLTPPGPWLTVVGVVSNVRHFGYEDSGEQEMYTSWHQVPHWATSFSLVARASGSTADLATAIRAQVRSLDPRVAVELDLMTDRTHRSVADRRFTMQVLAAFGALALVLAAVGVYGVMSLSVAQRTRELAVRAALGADRDRLLRLVLREGLQVVVPGSIAGGIAALLGTKLIAGMLVDTSPHDPLVLGIAVGLIVAIGTAAAFVPALRATRAEPAVVLQGD